MKRHTLKQIWIVSGVFVNFFGHGMVVAYTSCLLPALRAPDSPIKIDLDTESWLGSIFGAMVAPGITAVAILMDRYGRKWVYALTSAVELLSWMILFWAKTLPVIMFGRLLGGFVVASGFASGCVVVAEYSSPEHRGIFMNMKTGALFLGTLAMHILEHYFDWRTVALISSIPCIVGWVNTFTWPESPSWLLAKNRFDQFEETFYELRGRGELANKELSSMIRAQKSRLSKKPHDVSCQQKVMNIFRKFKQRSFVRPLAIFFFCVILKESAGRNFFPAFAGDIMDLVTSDRSSKFLSIIFVDLVTIVSALTSCILIKHLGRKTLFMLSGIPASIIMICLSVMLYLISKGALEIKQPWIIPVMLCIFAIFANLGCTTLPSVLFGEIFPLPHRELGTVMSGCIMSLGFLFSMQMPKMLLYMKLYGTFAMLVVLLLVALAYLHFFMPETKDRTLQEIEDYFDYGRFTDEGSVTSSNDGAERMIKSHAQSNKLNSNAV